MYEIRKIAIDEGRSSGVPIGMGAKGCTLIMISEDNSLVYNPKLSDITTNVCMFIEGKYNYVKTSPISKIVEFTDGEIIFKTTSSTYKLTNTID